MARITRLHDQQEEEEEEVEHGQKKKKNMHGQNVKIHCSSTLDISGIFIKYLVYRFVSTCSVMYKC